MKKILFFAFTVIAFANSSAQSLLHISAGANYMNHSKLTGISIANDFSFHIADKHSLVIGFELGFAEGNRNFDRKKDGNSNVQFEGYYPNYFFFPYPSYFFTYPVELKALTSTTYQMSLRVGYDFSKIFKNERLRCVGGGYFTYIYKSYLAKTDYGLTGNIGSTLEPIKLDLSYPFNLRYIDIGFYVQFYFRPFKNKKLPVLNFTYSQGFQKNSSWCSLGLSKSIAVGKTKVIENE